ncbi:MAG: hypothetical protein QOK05_2688 [Chloroflexota bacterium]|nr:hypothetical protein [Chloroflexota bacterium]
MDTSQNERETENRQTTDTEERRDEHQREQVEAQAAGDTGAELKAFAKEFIDDHVQYPKDIVEDSKDPDRRVNEEQGTTTQPGSEPAEER